MKTVTIIDDNVITAEILKKQINNCLNYCCENYFLNPIQFLASDDNPDIVILDIIMPEMNGLEAIDKIISKNPEVLVIINSSKNDSETIFEAIQNGAIGYIDKLNFNSNLDEVFQSLENGGAYLSPNVTKKIIEFLNFSKKDLGNLSQRELEIAYTMIEGLSYKLIADKLLISMDTVRTHVKKIYKKLNINSKSELFNIFKN
jgi:DNA-binding NarL/FixJ family response regulator